MIEITFFYSHSGLVVRLLKRHMRFLSWWSLLLLFACVVAGGQVAVTTQHNDNLRTGQNLFETLLTTTNVNVNSFGKLFMRKVSGQIYAQPLYVPNLTIAGTVHNVVFVATEANNVYAFDADDPSASAPLWHRNLGTPVPYSDVASTCKSINPLIGVTSTPVIDTSTNTLYVVAKTKNTSNSTYHFKLHALNLLSGSEQFGGPIEIVGQVPGTGAGSSNGYITFSAFYHNSRPGLLLLNGTVYLAFASLCDIGVWHGWLFGYSASTSTLQQVAVYNASANGASAGIWQGGQGLLAIGTDIYLMTANGTFDKNTGGVDFGDSFLRISTLTGLTELDYFTPFNQAVLSANDSDLGAGGPVAIPNTNFIVGIGKDKKLRLVDITNMGQYHKTDQIVQEFVATPHPFMGAPIYWSSTNYGPVIYLWGSSDYLKEFQLVSGLFQTSPVSQSTMLSASGYSNSVPLSLTANGTTLGSAIVWAAVPLGNASNKSVPGILRAFDATDLTNELWDSNQNAARDALGNFAKFCPPTIANGKVYVATFSNQLAVYGLLPLQISSKGARVAALR
jgi:hypothetical protein